LFTDFVPDRGKSLRLKALVRILQSGIIPPKGFAMEIVDGKAVVKRITESRLLMIDGNSVETGYIKCTHDRAQVKYEGYFLYEIDPAIVFLIESEVLYFEDGTSTRVSAEKPLTAIAKELDENSVFEIRAINGEVTAKTTVFD